MHGGGKKTFFSGERFCRPDFHCETLRGAFNWDTDTECKDCKEVKIDNMYSLSELILFWFASGFNVLLIC